MSKIKNIIRYIKDYRIHVVSSREYQGIKDTLLGWAIIGFSIIFTPPISDPITLEVSFIIVFFVGALGVILNVLFDSILKGEGFNGITDLLIRSNTDKSPIKAHLTTNQRIKSIYFRGFIAASNFIALNIAKIYFDAIDNSAIFGADAIVFVGLSAWILKKRISLKKWAGIFIACSGVFLILAYDLGSFDWMGGLISGAAGIYSAFTFAIIFFITSIIVRHDTPKRVVFHQCIAGTLISIAALIINMLFVQFPEEKSLFSQITPDVLKNSAILGILYAWALYRFLRAFLYTDPTIIAVLGYSLFIFVILFDYLFQNGAIITYQNILSSILITTGCAIVVYDEHKKDKVSSKNARISKPIYNEKHTTND